MEKVADVMAETLLAAVAAQPMPRDVAHLYLTDPIADLGRIDGIMFSGGVAEYIYERENRDFGDMGPRLGRAIRARVAQGAFPWPVLPAGECIRATALGASEYSVQLSGNTSYISSPGTLLPRRNLQVLQPPFEPGEAIDPEKLAAAIKNHIVAFDLQDGDREIALALRWNGKPAHERLLAFAEGVKRALADPSKGKSRSSSCSTATWRRRSATSCATSSASKASSWSSTAWCCGILTISISVAFACPRIRCR